MTERDEALAAFLTTTRWAGVGRQWLAGDASARQYQRLILPETGESAVLMDAPPGRGEDVRPFVQVAEYLTNAGFSAPAILAEDATGGFLLLEDLGDAVFARLIGDDPGSEGMLYGAAVDVLVQLHRSRPPSGLARFTPRLMAEQAALVYNTYAGSSGQGSVFQAKLETVLKNALLGPLVPILRDYHAENLIWLPQRDGIRRVGLLDFQDAMLGPAGYDLVSLLYDARRDLAPGLADRMTARFVQATGLEPADFDAARAALCVQRNLRILGIFARLSLEHDKPGYIDLIPRVWDHLTVALAHPALRGLAEIVRADLPPPTPDHLDHLRTPCP